LYGNKPKIQEMGRVRLKYILQERDVGNMVWKVHGSGPIKGFCVVLVEPSQILSIKQEGVI